MRKKGSMEVPKRNACQLEDNATALESARDPDRRATQ